MFKFYRKITDGPRGQDIETDYYDTYLTNGKQQNRNRGHNQILDHNTRIMRLHLKHDAPHGQNIGRKIL
jgi:hypothetical protein